jgi:hypothetical protein
VLDGIAARILECLIRIAVSAIVNLDGKSFALIGPMQIDDPQHTPVRGDLADIRLAGRYFVPHYAVPQNRTIVATGAPLLSASRGDAETLAALAGGSAFAVIDVAGDWAWGQAGGESGLVGYVALMALQDPA